MNINYTLVIIFGEIAIAIFLLGVFIYINKHS